MELWEFYEIYVISFFIFSVFGSIFKFKMNYDIFPLNILLDVNIISVCVRWDGRDLASLALELTLAAMTQQVTFSQTTSLPLTPYF